MESRILLWSGNFVEKLAPFRIPRVWTRTWFLGTSRTTSDDPERDPQSLSHPDHSRSTRLRQPDPWCVTLKDETRRGKERGNEGWRGGTVLTKKRLTEVLYGVRSCDMKFLKNKGFRPLKWFVNTTDERHCLFKEENRYQTKRPEQFLGHPGMRSCYEE